MSMSISYEDFLSIDMHLLLYCIRGKQKLKESSINDNLAIGHRTAAKIAQAVWGSRSFNDVKPIKLGYKPIDDEEREDDIRKKEIQTNNTLNTLFGGM